MFKDILAAFGLNPNHYTVEPFGPGLINHTLKVTGQEDAYILQQLNTQVFKSPESIADNLNLIDQYFKKEYPAYLFVHPLADLSGNTLVRSAAGDVYRLFPFIKNSHTITTITDAGQAFEAAKQFGRFTSLLKNFDAAQLKATIPNFHNLPLRYKQFKEALINATEERLTAAEKEIKQAAQYAGIVQTYNEAIGNEEIPLRVIHHDTKISNVLFDGQQNGLCVIDLDTVMPGYYLSDVGDMMRTYLSPANEEETDLQKVYIRKAIFEAIYDGYLSEMGGTLTPAELELFTFSGKMMIYMQALRFLTDYLNNDVYYGARYPGHNLNRAKNQFRLLGVYVEAVADLKNPFNAPGY